MRRAVKRLARLVFGLTVVAVLLGSVALTVNGSLEGIQWATRPIDAPTSQEPEVSAAVQEAVQTQPAAPELLSRAARWAAAAVAQATGETPEPAALGGLVPGACGAGGIPVTVSSQGVDISLGIHVLVGVSTAGLGQRAYEEAVSQTARCPAAYVTSEYLPYGQFSVVSGPAGQTWYVARHLDIIAVVATADKPSQAAARDLAVQLMSQAVTVSGCAGGRDSTSPYDGGYAYPVEQAEVRLEDVDSTGWLPSEDEYLMETGSEEEVGDTTVDTPVPDELENSPQARPVVSLAPLLTREEGGNGLLRGPAPLLVDPQDIPEPSYDLPQTLESEPTIAALEGTVSIFFPTDDLEGPGCGWDFLGTVAPDSPSPSAVRQAVLSSYTEAARSQTLTLQEISAYPLLLAEYVKAVDARAAWDSYEEAIDQAQKAWLEAEERYRQAEEYWDTPVPTPSRTPTPTPSPAPTQTPTPTPEPSGSATPPTPSPTASPPAADWVPRVEDS